MLNLFLISMSGSVPGASFEEASRACEAMTVAGTVLRHGAIVYLRPAEVLATINKVLPFNQEDIKNRLKEVDMNLGALEAKYAEITRGVKMRTVVINYAVLAGLAAQWGILFRLTYWELSWDVMVSVVCKYGAERDHTGLLGNFKVVNMNSYETSCVSQEPVGFFIGGCSSLLSFAWFLRTQRDFSYETMHKRFMSGYERRAFEKGNFNVQEFNRLKQERARLLSLLQCDQVNHVDVAK